MTAVSDIRPLKKNNLSCVCCAHVELAHFFPLSPPHVRRELGPGPACCVGPVGERRCGQEHHHHGVSAGSQACWQEGEFKSQLCVCAAEYRVSVYADMLLSY